MSRVGASMNRAGSAGKQVGYTTWAGQSRALDAAALSPDVGSTARDERMPSEGGAIRLDLAYNASCPSRVVPAVIGIADPLLACRGVAA